MVSPKSFNITRLGTDALSTPLDSRNPSNNPADLVNYSSAFYAVWDTEFEFKAPGQESFSFPGGGILYCQREDGKVKLMTAYEDPTPFVAMAMKGQMGPPA